MMRRSRWLALAILVNLCLSAGLAANEPPDVDRYLAQGRIQAGIDSAQAWLGEHPADNQVQLGLGMLRFVQAVEGLSQDLHHYGLRDLGRAGGVLPFLRLPVPENPTPARLDYAASREILVRVIARLKAAEADLARVDGDAKLRIRLAAARLDMDGDGEATPKESLWLIYERLNAQARRLADDSDSFAVAFDRADAHWLRGYCNVLMAFAEFALAHDWRDAFDRTAHVFFANVESPYPFLKQQRSVFRVGDGIDIADVIAFVHLINYRVAEPQRMGQVRLHLKEMLVQSREMWRHAQAETDNDREWIPNAANRPGSQCASHRADDRGLARVPG